MNYEQMSDGEITWRVHHVVNKVPDGYATICTADYCNNPSDAWPIIVDNGITICPDVYIGGWYGQKDIDSGMDGDSIHVTKDTNPLRAAMICFLKMKELEK